MKDVEKRLMFRNQNDNRSRYENKLNLNLKAKLVFKIVKKSQ